MQCARIQRMLANYALGDARVTERLCVEVHTSHCPSCRKELEDICELVAASERALTHPCPSDDFGALMARIEACEMPPRDLPVNAGWSWRTISMRVVAAAAIVAVIAVAAPVARNARLVMRDLQEVSTDAQLPADETVQVPLVSEPFVKRARTIEDEYGALSGGTAIGAVDPLLP